MSRKNEHPTVVQYGNLQHAYNYFNKLLFDGQLADCLITLRSHGKRTLGLFHAEQWVKEETKCHEIALSPAYLSRSLQDVFSTLVHEMCHLWQQDFGKPSRNGYHNKEWGDKMEEIGLCPSNTGKPGGKKTGQQMTHYIVPNGAYAAAYIDMPDSIKLPWVGVAPVEKGKKVSTKLKYSCGGCQAAVWGKPGLHILCEDCDEALTCDE